MTFVGRARLEVLLQRPYPLCARTPSAKPAGATARNELHDLIDKCHVQLGALHKDIVKAYFDYRPRRTRQSAVARAGMPRPTTNLA